MDPSALHQVAFGHLLALGAPDQEAGGTGGVISPGRRAPAHVLVIVARPANLHHTWGLAPALRPINRVLQTHTERGEDSASPTLAGSARPRGSVG